MTRTTLTPYNEHSLNTNTDLKHAYLSGNENKFPEAWLSRTLMKPLRSSRSPPAASLHDTTPPISPRPLTQCQKWESIWWSGNSLEKGDNEVSQVWISSTQFPHPPRARLGTLDAWVLSRGRWIMLIVGLQHKHNTRPDLKLAHRPKYSNAHTYTLHVETGCTIRSQPSRPCACRYPSSA